MENPPPHDEEDLELEEISSWVVLSPPTEEQILQERVHVNLTSEGWMSAWMGLSSCKMIRMEVSFKNSSKMIWKSRADVERFVSSFPVREEETSSPSEKKKHPSLHQLERAMQAILRSHEHAEKPAVRTFFASNSYDSSYEAKLALFSRLPRSVVIRILSFLSPVEIIRASRVDQSTHIAAVDHQVWIKKGFSYPSATSVFAFSEHPLLEPATYTVMVHGDWSKLPRLLLGVTEELNVAHHEALYSTIVGHSLINIRFVAALGADDRGAVGRIVISSSNNMDDEDIQAHVHHRSNLPQAVLIADDTDRLQRDAALSSFFHAIIVPPLLDDENAPYSLVDYIGLMQITAKFASKAFVLLPCKLGPAIMVFGLAGGFSFPVAMLGASTTYASLAVRAMWYYPNIAAFGAALSAALIATPQVGRPNKNRWVKMTKKVCDLI